MIDKVPKLRRISLNELRVRGSQLFAMYLERRGWSSLAQLTTEKELLTKLRSSDSSTEELYERFKTRTEPRFFGAFSDREATLREFRTRHPHQTAKLIDKANSVAGGRFDLLGYENLSFGDPIDWRLEPISGKRAPRLHWSRLNFLDAAVVGDKKIIWELNRHQYFITLGQAYWLTADETYARAFVDHLQSWMEENPPKIGINWASSLEVSFRSVSWIWALYFFRESPSLTEQIFTRALKFLYLHARHLETYLSTYFSPNTHLTGEALGLFYLGTLLPEFKESARWRKTGFRILVEQLSRHVKPDGVYFEQSSYYHRYTTDFYLHLLILLRVNNEAVPVEVEKALLALLDHLMYITRPDGTTPLFGDDDGGRLVPLSSRAANDFRATLATAAAVFERADYKYVSGDASDEAVWLLGAASIQKSDQIHSEPPSKQSAAFKNGGYYVMRDGWTATSNYLLFDAGPHGTDNCGHAHADALSLELAADGRTLLIDPGTCTYTGSTEMRNWFRSSAAHNTITIDGKSSSIPAGPFSWRTIANTDAENWISRRRFDFVEGRHDGYASLPEPASISRSVLFLKHDYWILRDKIRSSGKHNADLWFHFDPRANTSIDVTQNSRILNVGELDICVFGNEGRWRKEDAWVSTCYGQKVSAPAYAFSATLNGDAELVTFLLPQPVGMKRVIREIETIGGRAFEVTHTNGLDIVMIRAAGASRVETARLASDFEWTWVRFSDQNESLPEEFVLLSGHNLELEGREILKSKREINYFAGHSLGETFQVETDDGTFDLSLPIVGFESHSTSSSRASKI